MIDSGLPVTAGDTTSEVARQSGGGGDYRWYWPVHIVVVPKHHVPSLVDLGDIDETVLHKVPLRDEREVTEQA